MRTGVIIRIIISEDYTVHQNCFSWSTDRLFDDFFSKSADCYSSHFEKYTFASAAISNPQILPLKGTVARDFWPLVFSTNRPHICSPRIHTLKYFRILFRIRRIFVFECCSAGSDTPHGFVKRGIRPRRTLFCGVSDPAGHCSAVYQTPQNKCVL